MKPSLLATPTHPPTPIPHPPSPTPTLAAAFLATLAVGVWAAYDPAAAWGRAGLLAGGVLLLLGMAWLGRRWGDAALGWLALGAAWLAGAVALYCLQATDWATVGLDSGLLRRLALGLQGVRPTLVLPDTVNLNVAGAALAVLLPIGGAGVVWGVRQARTGRRAVALLSVLPVGAAGLTLILTESRGAWLGLAAGLAAALLGWVVLRRDAAGSRGRRGLAIVAVTLSGLLGAAAFAIAVAQPQMARWLGSVSGASRPELWRDMLALVRDYPLTGSGLGSTLMVDTSYVRLLHVGFIYHAHNLYLQTAIEQGLPGLVSLLAILALAAYRLLLWSEPGVLALGALAALVALGVNGLVDAGLYASRLAPLVFAAPGFALAVAAAAQRAAPPVVAVGARRGLWRSALVILAGCLLLLALPGVRADLQANLGAVAQSRAELAVYRWPDVGIQDELRRLEMVDLAPATGHYQAALALDPNNVTANRRLGQIELSRGELAAARVHLERAYAVAPGERATRQLLAEVYAVTGEVDRARVLWDSVDTGQGQLDLRIWWYEHQGKAEASQRLQSLRH